MVFIVLCLQVYEKIIKEIKDSQTNPYVTEENVNVVVECYNQANKIHQQLQVHVGELFIFSHAKMIMNN